jgi:hypothetical protein
MPWFPLIAAVFFGAVVLSTVLCILCQIREQTKPRE